MSVSEDFKLNYSNFINFLFSIPIGLAVGPLIAEILLNFFTILIIFEIIKKKIFKFLEKIFLFIFTYFIQLFYFQQFCPKITDYY